MATAVARGPSPRTTMASNKNLWLGILQIGPSDLNAIMNEIATGYLIYQNIDDGHRSELEYLCHRINGTRGTASSRPMSPSLSSLLIPTKSSVIPSMRCCDGGTYTNPSRLLALRPDQRPHAADHASQHRFWNGCWNAFQKRRPHDGIRQGCPLLEQHQNPNRRALRVRG